MLLVDTSFIIDLINSDAGAVGKAKEIDEKQVPVSISSITVQEYLRGVYYLFGENSELLERKLFQAESDLARFEVIDFTYQLAKLAAKIDAKLTREGQAIGMADVIIGTTAIDNNLRILTRNINHFERIDQLMIEKY